MNATQLMTLADAKTALNGAVNPRKLAKTLWVHAKLTADAANYIRAYL